MLFPQAEPSTGRQFPHLRIKHLHNLHRHRRADRIPLSALNSAQRLNYLALADSLTPNSCGSPARLLGAEKPFWRPPSLLALSLMSQPRDKPTALCSCCNFSQIHFWHSTGSLLRNSSQLSSALLKNLKPPPTDPSLCPVCTADYNENCFISFFTQISYWLLPSSIMLKLLCHHLFDDLPPSHHS